MKDLKLLLTASGFYGASTLCEQLRKNGERKIEIIGVDMNPNCPAQFYCDKFYAVPQGRDYNFIKALLDICKTEKPDVILPGSSCDVYNLAFHKNSFDKLGIKIMVSNPQVLDMALDKWKTYQKLQGIVPLPNYFLSRNGVVFKPVEGKGARGIKIFEDKGLIMEKLEGEEIDADVLSQNGEVLLAMFKTRERTYGGTLVEGRLIDRPELYKQIVNIIKTIPIDYLSVIQFKGGKLLELNPRCAGAVIYPENWNMPYLAIKLALGEITGAEIKKYQDKIPFGLRVTKYLSQIQYV